MFAPKAVNVFEAFYTEFNTLQKSDFVQSDNTAIVHACMGMMSLRGEIETSHCAKHCATNTTDTTRCFHQAISRFRYRVARVG
jgi:hypothetical protein